MDEIRLIPLTAIKESPFNPRKTYPQDELEELADSIRTQGVMQPIVVRIQPEEVNADGHFEYEVVFGHRRFRGAAIAGRDDIPAIVRVMNDEQAAIAQVHENMKRKDVTALEEADSYVHLRTEHRMTAEQIGLAVGKTKAYVYARLKLASVASEVRDAVMTRGLSPEIALLIARLPHIVLQRAALAKARLPDFRQVEGEPEQWVSVRDTKRMLKELFELDVDVAQFDTTDAKLIDCAGACTDCPKRAGNMEGLSEILDPGICTDSDCYKQKQEAFVWLRTDQLRADGRTVIEGEAAVEQMETRHYIKDYTTLDNTVYDPASSTNVSMRQLLDRPGAPKIVPAAIVNPFDGRIVDVVTDEEAQQLHEFARNARAPREPGAEERDAKRQAERDAADAAIAALSPSQRACMDMDILRDVRRAVLMAMVEAPRSVEDLRLMVLREMTLGDTDLGVPGELVGLRTLLEAEEETAGDDFDSMAWGEHWVREVASPDQLALLMSMIAVEEALSWCWQLRYKPEHTARLVAIANAYGVDPADFLPEEEREPAADDASTPSLAARAQEAAEGQKAQDDDALADAAADSQPSPPAKKAKPVKKAAPAKKAAKVKRAAKVKIATDNAGSAGEDQTDEPADAGSERDPNTSDMFAGAQS